MDKILKESKLDDPNAWLMLQAMTPAMLRSAAIGTLQGDHPRHE